MYAYWFGGRRLLERPLAEHPGESGSRDPLLPLLGKRSHGRGWDGGNDDLLLEQRHSAQGDVRIIDDLAEHFSDDRYVKINGNPLFLIYRAEFSMSRDGRSMHCATGRRGWAR